MCSIGGPPSGGPPAEVRGSKHTLEGTGSVAGMPACSGPGDGGLRPVADRVRLRADATRCPRSGSTSPMRLADDLGVLDAAARRSPAPMADDDLIATVHEPGADRGGEARRRGPDRRSSRRTGSAATTTRSSRGMHRRRRPRGRRHRRGVPPGVERREPARANICRRPAPRDARPGQRLLHLQRRRRRHPLAARPGRRAGRLRRRRRPPRRRRRADLLRRPAGAHDLACTRPARCCSPAPASRTTPAARTRRAARSTSRCRPARRTPAGCGPSTRSCPPLVREFAPDVLVTQHGCDCHLDDPLAAPDAQRRRPARVVPRPARPRPRGRATGAGWSTGGGGYALVDVVPRAWTHLLAVVGGHAARPGDRDARGVARARPRAARPHRRRSG